VSTFPARQPRSRPRPARWPLVIESLDEGEFLWRMRERLLVSPRHTLDDVQHIAEERLLGCADGVWLAGKRAVDTLLIPALSGDEPRRCAFAAYVLADHELDDAWQALLAFMRTASAEQLAHLRPGLCLGERRDQELVHTLREATASEPFVATILEACAFRGLNAGPHLADWAKSADLELAERAVLAARFAKPQVARRTVHHGLAGHAEVRAAALETGLLLQLPEAESAARELFAHTSNDERLQLLAAVYAPHSLALSSAPSTEQVWALGFAGTRAAADLCQSLVEAGQHAALAYEAFCAITGAQCAELPVDPEAEDVELPVPERAAMAHWWRDNRARFDQTSRYLLGQPSSQEALRSALGQVAMRRRHGLALDLAVQSAGQQQLNSRTWSARQRQQLAAATSLPLRAATGS
jgi:uncharacterized protein (TIGR02270 family)